jgi:hypothetical protein
LISTVLLQSFYDGIMKLWTDLSNGLVGAVRPDAICEQDNRKLAFGIDPDRSAGVSEMAKSMIGKVPARLGWR